MAKNDDEIQTADYKTTASGKKVRAHRIVFNKGEEDNTKLREESELDERALSDNEMNKREDIVKGMKKNYKGFVSKYGKDRAKSVMYATATKLAKEETEMKDNDLMEQILNELGETPKGQKLLAKVRARAEKRAHDERSASDSAYAHKQRAANVRSSSRMSEEIEQIDELDEAKKANTASARAELAKRPAKPLTGADADKKKKESDAAWERLMAHAASMKKEEVEVVDEELKGNQHKLDKNKNGKLDKKDFELIRKEETEQVEERVKDFSQKPAPFGNAQSKTDDRFKAYLAAQRKKRAEAAASSVKKEEVEQIEELSKTTLGNYYNAAKQDNRDHADSRRSGDKDEAKWAKDRMVKRTTGMGAAKNRLNKEEIEMMDEAHPFDIPKSSGMATSTRTNHDVKKTSTGTVYTKQRDTDGNSKEFKRDPDQAKRGRGRPKKNSFSEAAQFLMSLTEEQFNDVTSEGFDIFFESFENINK